MITRFAPTPSGYLHVGNAVNAVLVSRLARQHAGTMALRIDDMDAPRSRPEYVDDAFDLLTWLGIDWQVGPRDRQDFEAQWTLAHRTERYREVLSSLPTYCCTCSRRDLSGPAAGGCPGGCRSAGLPFERDRTAVRVRVPVGTTIDVGGVRVPLGEVMGDFVVWRRDDLPSYQLASLVEDHDLGVTHIVRGEDLRDSTAAQLFLARELGLDGFARVAILHHGLVAAPDGSKLSKSTAVHGAPLPRTDAVRTIIARLADELGAPLGITDRR